MKNKIFNFVFFMSIFVNHCYSVEYVYGDIIISEFLSDPTPNIGLGENEYIELYNPSDYPIELSNFEFSDASSSVKLTNVILGGSFLVFYKGDLDRWPSLNNGGDQLSIWYDSTLIYTVLYDLDSLNDIVSNEGGVAFEIKTTSDYTGSFSSDYAYSTAEIGGTPGQLNSVNINYAMDGMRYDWSVHMGQLYFEVENQLEAEVYLELFDVNGFSISKLIQFERVLGKHNFEVNLNSNVPINNSSYPTPYILYFWYRELEGVIVKKNICIVL